MAERKQGNLSSQFWWEQIIDLKEEEDGDASSGGGGIYLRLLYDEAGNLVHVGQQGVQKIRNKTFLNSSPCTLKLEC